MREPVNVERTPDRFHVARRQIIKDRISSDVIQRVLSLHVARRFSDNDRKLCLPVDKIGYSGQPDISLRANDAMGACFEKEIRVRVFFDELLATRHLFLMIYIVCGGVIDDRGIQDRRAQLNIRQRPGTLRRRIIRQRRQQRIVFIPVLQQFVGGARNTRAFQIDNAIAHQNTGTRLAHDARIIEKPVAGHVSNLPS